jgi:hypothetical protein
VSSSNPTPDLAAAATTLDQIERLTRRLRRQLGDPEPSTARRGRPRQLRDLALQALSREWMTLPEWERALLAQGYQPPKDAKRPDQIRRSLSSLAARNKHLIDTNGRGIFRLRENPDDLNPDMQ